MSSPDIDTRSYFLIENPERDLQIILMTVMNFISTTVNFLGFYLILIESKREWKVYRSVLFTHNLSLFLAQFFNGSIINVVMLFPFPAFYSIGPLSAYVDMFLLLAFWVLIFGFSVVMMYVIVLVRLKLMTKPGDTFHFGFPAYAIFTAILCAYIYFPVFYLWYSGLNSKEYTRKFVETRYPNCLNVFNFPGVFIYTNPEMFKYLAIGAVFLLGTGAALYLIICVLIIYQIQRQCFIWSQKQLKHHRKVLKDTVIQNALRAVCLIIAPVVQVGTSYLDPETDLKTLSILANVTFSAAPIPCTIAMFFQTPHYRKFIISKFKRIFKEQVSSSSEVIERSIVVGPRKVQVSQLTTAG